jgi:hypothetical protein
MESLPPEIARFILEFRSLFRVEVFDSFIYLFYGVLLGEAKYGTVRSAVFAVADYQPQRLSDLFCRHKLSHQAFIAQLASAVLERVYGRRLPERLFWIADSTQSEKPYSERVASLGWFHRTKRVAGRAKKLKGHCYVFAAHLYRHTREKKERWGSVLVGALLYVKGRTIPQLVVELAKHLRLPAGIRHCWIVDRGIISRGLCRELAELGQFVLGRMRSNQVVYFAPQESVDLYSAEVLLRGVWRGRAFPARIIIVVVPELAIKPWYLLSTDLELDPCETVNAYDGRYQIEVNFDEVKELGLGHYQGRSAQGVRRWPLFLSAVQAMLKLIATGKIPALLPTLNWEWYEREDSVGQVRRRIIEHCRPPLSRTKVATASLK